MKDFHKLLNEIKKSMTKNDPSHDLEHIRRVCDNAEMLCKQEKANKKLVIAAALLHDIVSYPKNDTRAKTSSTKSALLAKKILKKMLYTDYEIKIITDAIESHSFSKNKKPKTIEGKILQDADRLDAIGAIGIARTFAVGGAENRSFYETKDPFCRKRKPNDQKWTLDHFYKKLLKIESNMNTKSAKMEAKRRTKIIKKFLKDLEQEIYP